ncbi:MAG: YbbR domain-containing protein [Limisphaerales bacterium]|jgi:YbbR domain-containing protein
MTQSGLEKGTVSNSRSLIILICFGLAAVLWLLNALSKEHIAIQKVKLEWEGIGETQATVVKLPEEAKLRVKGNGWQLFYSSFRRKNVKIDLSKYAGRDILITKTIPDEFTSDIPNSFELKDIKPDSISIKMDKVISKKLPVKLIHKLQYDPTSGMSSHIELSPDSILITGARSNIEKLNYWATELLDKSKISETVEGEILIKHAGNLNLEFDTKVISYAIPVSAYTEGSKKVVIRNTSFYQGANLKIVPAKANVVFQAPLHIFDDIESGDFIVEADLTKLKSGKTNTLPLRLISAPKFVRNVRLNPDKVEYYFLKEIDTVEQSNQVFDNPLKIVEAPVKKLNTISNLINSPIKN